VVGAGSLVGRYRRARGTERLQLRWLALAAAVSTAALLAAILPIPALGDGATWFAVGFGVSLAVAGATLAVAGAFQPARRRIQQAVDHPSGSARPVTRRD
jgi:peptidoglycan/LPS O-acetylase OafA/YrhL